MKGIIGKGHRRLQTAVRGSASSPLARARGRPGLTLVAIVAVIAAALTAACDGKDGGRDTPAAPPPTATASPEQLLLEQSVLQAEDMPEGLARVDASTSTNEDVAAGEADPEQALAQLEGWGRVLGYEVSFVVGTEAPAVQDIVAVSSAASLYLTAEGASASFADAAQEARDANWPASYPDLIDLDVRTVDRPNLADEVIWIRITGIRSGADGRLFTEDFVVTRRGRLRGFLRAGSLTDPSASRDVFIEEVAGLAALQVQRIDAALQGSPP